MSHAKRIEVAAALYMGDAIIMVWWLYFQPEIAPLMQQFDGPFTTGWEMLQWVIPTFCTIMFLLISGWLVIGGVQEEESRNRRRVR